MCLWGSSFSELVFCFFLFSDGSPSCCFYSMLGRKCLGRAVCVRCVVSFRVLLTCRLLGGLSLFCGSHLSLRCFGLFSLVRAGCSSDLTRDSLSSASCTFVVVFAVCQLHGLLAHQLGLLMLSDGTAHNSLHGHHGWIDTHVAHACPNHHHRPPPTHQPHQWRLGRPPPKKDEEEEEEEEAQTSKILFLMLPTSLCSAATCSSSPTC